MSFPVQQAIDVIGVASAVLAIPLAARHFLRPGTVGELGPGPSTGSGSRWAGVLLHPWTLFLATSVLCVANQVAVNAYILAARGGDATFITKHVGAWYFNGDLDFPGVRALAALLGPSGARWLEPAILRVNAFLELPFAMFAYLAIARLFDRGVPGLLQRSLLGPLAAASYTAVLMLVEVLLWNPYTRDDLIIRVVAGVLVAFALAALGRRERGVACFPDATGRRRTLPSLLVAFVGAACAAGAVLAFYDLTLLYNLGHLEKLGGPLAAMLAVATGAFLGVERVDDWLAGLGRRSACVEAVSSVAATLSVVFFVPALAVRYGLHHPVGRICGLALLAISTAWGLAAAARAPGVHARRWAIGLGCGMAAGLAAVKLVYLWIPAGAMIEAVLVLYAAAFVAAMLFAWRLVERAVPSIEP
ncbi:MAG TPA: hypothetical protein VGK67_30830 [Myxococcales bacterium]